MTNTLPQLDTIPSILEQSPFDVGIFSFGKAEASNIDYFNPSIVARPDGDWLIVRRSTWKPQATFGMNDLMAFKLDGKTPTFGVKIRIPKTATDEQFEDPRAFYHNGKTYIGACNFVWYGTRWTGAHQILVSCDDEWKVTDRTDPDYGKNGNALGKNQGHEKNWLWFVHEGQLHMIYMAAPKHHVVSFDRSMGVDRMMLTEWNYGLWKHGQVQGNTPKIGGGTPPVRVGSEMFTFFHSSTLMENGKRRYHMGAMAFEAEPPFRITRITPEPILSGSKNDIWDAKKVPCVFPGGAIHRDGKWLIVGGLNDRKCFYLEMSHDDLNDILIEV